MEKKLSELDLINKKIEQLNFLNKEIDRIESEIEKLGKIIKEMSKKQNPQIYMLLCLEKDRIKFDFKSGVNDEIKLFALSVFEKYSLESKKITKKVKDLWKILK